MTEITVRNPGARRPLALAASLGLAIALMVPALASAAAGANATTSGDTLTATVTGTARTGVWRIRVVGPNGNRRVDFVLRSGDISWHGAVRVSARVEGGWRLISVRPLRGGPDGLQRASGRAAGLRWDTARFSLPRNGNSRFSVAARMTRPGSYRVVGALRNAAEAFSYGRWTSMGSQSVQH